MQQPPALLTFVDAIPAMVAYVDCNMVLQYCNRPFRAWFVAGHDAAGKSFPYIAGKEMFDQLQRHMGKVLVGERAHFQIITHADNGLQFLDATLSPDFDERNHVKGFVFHCADITEKSKTERALKDYFENASIGLHWVNAEGIVIWANPAELKMLGYDENEYVGQHISKFHASEAVIGDILTRLQNKESIRNYDADLVCKDGSIRHVTINSTGLWEGDKFIHTRCFTVDVTEQRRAARAVKESEERFRMMANLVPLVIWTSDEHGQWSFLSTGWEQLTGQSPNQAAGKQWLNRIHPDDRSNITKSWTWSHTAYKPFESKFRLLNAAGEYRVVYVNATPRQDSAGNFSGYIGILQDISQEEQVKHSLEKVVLDRTSDLRRKNADLARAEQALLKKNDELKTINAQLSSFASIASHDLQEPLRKIRLFVSRLFELEGDKFSDKGKELYNHILSSADRMRILIKDLLAYSKSSDDSVPMESVDLNMLLNDVLSEVEVQVGEKQAIIENRGLPTLNVIKFQFHQLFLNLITNALKFSSADRLPHIILMTETVDGKTVPHPNANVFGYYHHITVSDNGIGFDPQSAGKIFEIFKRLHNRSQYEGTGIGLAICKKVVENHHGVIVANGQAGEGATFHIYLPLTVELHEGSASDLLNNIKQHQQS